MNYIRCPECRVIIDKDVLEYARGFHPSKKDKPHTCPVCKKILEERLRMNYFTISFDLLGIDFDYQQKIGLFMNFSLLGISVNDYYHRRLFSVTYSSQGRLGIDLLFFHVKEYKI